MWGITSTAWSPDGKHIAAQSDGRVVTIWDATSHQAVCRFDAGGDIHACLGHTGGGVVNVSLKSGTNRLRGSLFENFRNTMRCAFDERCLHLAFLEIDGHKAAGYLSLDYLNQLWVYNSGMDVAFIEYSPGWVLLGYLLQWANEHKRTAFDFMRGNEEYKYRFGALDRFVVRLTIRRQPDQA